MLNKYLKYKNKYVTLKNKLNKYLITGGSDVRHGSDNIFLNILQNLRYPTKNIQETKKETTPETKQETTPETKQETTPETKQETKQETTPETKQETTPETKQETINLPIFELYQYNIVNYPNLGKTEDNLKFTFIENSEEDTCDNFSVHTDNQVLNDTTLSLCDIITDSSPNVNNTIYKLTIENYITDFYKYLYYAHNILKPKYFTKDNINNNSEYIKDTIIPEEIILLLLNNIKSRYVGPTIKILTATHKDKYIIMGDFHGSLHSFIRILFRLHRYNVIDITSMKLKDDYHLIFLGDVIDRGMYSIEILTIILFLLQENTNVHFIAGNHEASYPVINNRDGFLQEMTFKYNNDNLYKQLNELFVKLPITILLHEPINNQTIWMSHGCFNASGYYNYQLKDIDYNKEKEISITTTNHDLINSILWSDIAYIDNHVRGAGAYYNNNTREQFRQFMTENRITGVIRGHQDNYSNSIIYYHNNDNGTNYMKINEITNANVCDEKQVCYNTIVNSKDRVNGALARVVVSIDSYTIDDKYQPVITISTATDIKKSLYADSFGLLRFDINNIKDFTNSLTKQISIPSV